MVKMKRYVFVRMPFEIHQKYVNVKHQMENDIQKVTGQKNLRLTMPKVFNAVISPDFNENYIQVDLRKLAKVARKRKG
jgi:hypothetical protein